VYTCLPKKLPYGYNYLVTTNSAASSEQTPQKNIERTYTVSIPYCALDLDSTHREYVTCYNVPLVLFRVMEKKYIQEALELFAYKIQLTEGKNLQLNIQNKAECVHNVCPVSLEINANGCDGNTLVARHLKAQDFKNTLTKEQAPVDKIFVVTCKPSGCVEESALRGDEEAVQALCNKFSKEQLFIFQHDLDIYKSELDPLARDRFHATGLRIKVPVIVSYNIDYVGFAYGNVFDVCFSK